MITITIMMINHLLAKGMTGALLGAAQNGELKASWTFT